MLHGWEISGNLKVALYQVHVVKKTGADILLHKGFKIEFKGSGGMSKFKVLKDSGM